MTFSIRFLLCNVVIAALLGVILLFKRISRKHVTVSSQYHIWYIFMLALLLPFIPHNQFRPDRLLMRIQRFLETNSAASVNPSSSGTAGAASVSSLGVSDLAVSADSTVVSTLTVCLSVIWTAGCILTTLYFLYNIYKIYRIQKYTYPITAENEPELYSEYTSCMEELNIKRSVSLYASCSISSPVSYGLIRPKIMIPQDMDIELSAQDLRYIFLHELQHYKHKDAVLNYVSCIFQILYWFNPLIWYGFRVMRKDREIACDHSVIRTVGREHAASYGYTLIRYAEKLRQNVFLSPLSRLGGEKKVIVQRIREIADYKSESPLRKFRGVCVLLLSTMVVYAASPFLTANASTDNTYHFSGENTESIDLSSYFNGKNGSFVLYDTAKDHYMIYNEDLSTQRVSPDSTFKIYSGLFALEEGIISADSTERAWDGTVYSIDSWNQDQTLATAMQNSANWYFQELDEQTGYPALRGYYTKIGYGNCDLSGGIEDYWAESTLKISPAEQVALLSDLLRNKWGFDPENIQAVKDALFISDTDMGTLYGKTGTGAENGRNTNGWFVGFLETDGNVYCFSLNMQDSEGASGSAASKAAVNILHDLL